MRRYRRSRRALAEIVGTLMLVVIVVAAATAFSFFVAAYQKQVQAEETLTHDRALEDVKVIGLSEVSCATAPRGCESGADTSSFAALTILISSLDVNSIGVAELILDDHPIVNYTDRIGYGPQQSPCWNGSDSGPLHGLVPCVPWFIPADAAVSITLTLDIDNKSTLEVNNTTTYNRNITPALGGPFDSLVPTSDITLEVLTELTNVFTETFSPPDAVASVFFVSGGSMPVPVFDGLGSYQPAGAVNASILWYNWTITVKNTTTTFNGTGAEYQDSKLANDTTYNVTLTVTNTEGLTGSTLISYTQES